MKATGIYKGYETKNGFVTAIIEDTGLESSPGKRTKWFNAGKKPPTTASGTRVEFEYTSKDHENGNTYYSIKGGLTELGAAAPAASGGNVSQGNSPRPNDTNASIERQVILKAAVEFVVGSQGNTATPGEVVKAFNAFLPLLQPQATVPKPAPKRVEPEDENQDEQLPY